MDINPKDVTDDGCVVSLGPLSAACRELVSWYDQLIAGGQPPIQDLDRVITTLQLLPPVPGRIGRDIELIIDGGRNSCRDEIVGAVERLRSVGTHTPATPQAAVEPSRKRRRRLSKADRPKTTQSGGSQQQLPRLESETRTKMGGT